MEQDVVILAVYLVGIIPFALLVAVLDRDAPVDLDYYCFVGLAGLVWPLLLPLGVLALFVIAIGAFASNVVRIVLRR